MDAQNTFVVHKGWSAMDFLTSPKQIPNQHPYLSAPWSAYVDPTSEDIWKKLHVSMKLWAKLCTD